MSRLIDISDERFWQILFEEACVEGQQAERIEKELEKIVSFNLDKVVERLEREKVSKMFVGGRSNGKTLQTGINYGISTAIEIIKGGGVNERD